MSIPTEGRARRSTRTVLPRDNLTRRRWGSKQRHPDRVYYACCFIINLTRAYGGARASRGVPTAPTTHGGVPIRLVQRKERGAAYRLRCLSNKVTSRLEKSEERAVVDQPHLRATLCRQ